MQEGKRKINVDDMINTYNNLHDDDKAGLEGRNISYTTLVNAYYELATLFYEWGWGQSFHFAYQLKSETFQTAIARHEYYLAGRLGVKEGDKVLDCGCGIGGPMRNIARFTRANVTGVTLNEYQVLRGNELNKKAQLLDAGLAKSVQANFMQLPFENNSFDGVYAIEATCHAPQREGVYSEIFRVLKPGQYFACYEWCLTPKYDKNNEYHKLIKKKIEEGDGLPDMATGPECIKALTSVGFELVEARDMVMMQALYPLPTPDHTFIDLGTGRYIWRQRVVVAPLSVLEPVPLPLPVQLYRQVRNTQHALADGGPEARPCGYLQGPRDVAAGRLGVRQRRH